MASISLEIKIYIGMVLFNPTLNYLTILALRMVDQIENKASILILQMGSVIVILFIKHNNL